MTEPFIGEIQIFPFAFAPRGWALCNGQLLPINQNQALFSLLGTTYGGDGKATFALPDLRGRVPVHFGNGVTLGQSAGEETHTLTPAEMPTHTHAVMAGGEATAIPPAGNVWGSVAGQNLYAATATAAMAGAAISTAGSSQPHNNMQPYAVLNFCIALQGVFPSRN